MAMGPTPAALSGALWMGGTLLSFSAMAISVRQLLPAMGNFEILALRSLVSLALVLAVLPRVGLSAVRTHRPGLHAVRNLMHLGGQYAWVFAISKLPLASVFAIEFTMPVWTAVLAMLTLGERLNRGRVVMLVLGVVGILIILRPGVAVIQPAALVMLAGSLAYASTNVATRHLSSSDSALAVVFYMAVLQLPVALAGAWPSWVAPRLADVPWIVLVGTAGLTAHFCLTRAVRVADASLVVPIDFLRLPLIALVGRLFYDEALELTTLLGAAIMFAGTYYSIRREAMGFRQPSDKIP
jgi:drug/metabolite transporter (DMT)-like permease